MSDPVDEISARFPRLQSDGFQLTSPPTDTYNCVAWIARDAGRWWSPGVDGFYWPAELGAGETLNDFIHLFESLGFERCDGGELEAGIEKIAVYGDGDVFDHVAFQLDDGEWSSKLGELGDVRHLRADSIHGPGPFEYRAITVFMRRLREPHPLAERGLILP